MDPNVGGGYEPTRGAPDPGLVPSGDVPASVPATAPGPGPGQGPVAQDPVVLWIGDIGVSRFWVVTPNGTAPLAGSQWIVRDGTRVEQGIPAYAIVLTVVFFIFCLLGLLFLLIKEQRVVGYVEVTVRSGNLYHVAQLPARHVMDVDGVRRLVHQAQSMAYAQGQQ